MPITIITIGEDGKPTVGDRARSTQRRYKTSRYAKGRKKVSKRSPKRKASDGKRTRTYSNGVTIRR